MIEPVIPSDPTPLLRDLFVCRHSDHIAGRAGSTAGYDDLDLSAPVRAHLDTKYPEGIYLHQRSALETILHGADVCLSTGTASGKTLAFHLSALSLLAQNPKAKILVLYPLKALATEQEERWIRVIEETGVDAKVGVIMGGVNTRERPRILEESRVVIMTPDVLHSWCLPNIGRPGLRKWFSNLKLLIIDEVHVYTGIMGSNAAFLLRRLDHGVRRLKGGFQIFAASATLASPVDHVRHLTGRDAVLINRDCDTSPKQPVTVHLIESPLKHPQEATVKLIERLVRDGRRFIVFADSRQTVEQLGAQTAFALGKEDADEDDSFETSLIQSVGIPAVLPYRSGYEAGDRRAIEEALRSGALKGVVSTSALELGLDIQGLDTAVLYGMPATSTSFEQRIGRVGRTQPGTVFIVNAGSVLDSQIFAKPESWRERPPAEGALYLGNPRIQYVHALMLARPGGDDDLVGGSGGDLADVGVSWPDGFLRLCEDERSGQVPRELIQMKVDAGPTPQFAFPLRDVETQFAVMMKHGPVLRSLGSLSFAQAMREAYPGAVYYHMGKPYRVTNMNFSKKEILVRTEKKYYTAPRYLPTRVYPSLIDESFFDGHAFGSDLTVIDCDLQISEAVIGWNERRGLNLTSHDYPAAAGSGVSFQRNRFERNYMTSGVTIFHPLLDELGTHAIDVAQAIFEGLMLIIPFERQDIGAATDVLQRAFGDMEQGRRFIALHDKTYGSLRLASRIKDPSLMIRAIDAGAAALSAIYSRVQESDKDDTTEEDQAIAVEAALTSIRDLLADEEASVISAGGTAPTPSDRLAVIRPGSVGWLESSLNHEVQILNVTYSPTLQCTAYVIPKGDGSRHLVRFDKVLPIKGRSEMAWFDVDFNEVVDEPE